MFSNERSPAEHRSCNPSKTSSTEIDRGRCKIRSDTHGPSQRILRIFRLTRCVAAPRNLCRTPTHKTLHGSLTELRATQPISHRSVQHDCDKAFAALTCHRSIQVLLA